MEINENNAIKINDTKKIILDKMAENQKLKELANLRLANYEQLNRANEINEKKLVFTNSQLETLEHSYNAIQDKLDEKNREIFEFAQEIENLKSELSATKITYDQILSQLHKNENTLTLKDFEICSLREKNKLLESDIMKKTEKNEILEMTLEEIGYKLSLTTLEADDYRTKAELSQSTPWIDDEKVHNCFGCSQPFSLSRRKALVRLIIASLPKMWKYLLQRMLIKKNYSEQGQKRARLSAVLRSRVAKFNLV
ncbi:hypothetical protein RF11_05494 [Thelohanellus kitauei]|uniref:Uncharacterized protein n=1 Tax=Thelohanellus kitauei TaxID=669202 RepID=A0A0C2IHC9_THEKT|nr:hypothetical protein RF11_05494 [Thelohanellus kitauei]